MALDADIDFALMSDRRIREFAMEKGIPGHDSEERSDLVDRMRNNGLGNRHAMPGMENIITSLKELVESLTSDIRGLSGELMETKREVASLRKEFSSPRGTDLNEVSKPQAPVPQTTDTRPLVENAWGNGPPRATPASTSTPKQVQNASPATAAVDITGTSEPKQNVDTSNKRVAGTRGTRDSNRRIESSRYVAPKPPKSHAERSTLTGRPRVKVFYLGNIDVDCDAESIADHCKREGVDVVQVVVFSSEYFLTSYARVTGLQEDAARLGNQKFWPETIGFTVRPWRFASDGIKEPRGNASHS